MLKLVMFCSEGWPYDGGRDLRMAKDKMIERYSTMFDTITVYTPTLLRAMGLGQFCKEYDSFGVIRANREQRAIGFSAWKPIICKIELEKSSKDDIIVYHDVNCMKYKVYMDYRDFRGSVNWLINTCGFDFFLPQEHGLRLESFCKLNVLRELGEGHPFSFKYHQNCVNFMIFRNTPITMELLNEWAAACSVDSWIDGETYEKQLPCFQVFCPEQSILNTILANWIRKGKNGISKYWPRYYFVSRDINRPYEITNNSHHYYIDK
jgi:hypothetical protein